MNSRTIQDRAIGRIALAAVAMVMYLSSGFAISGIRSGDEEPQSRLAVFDSIAVGPISSISISGAGSVITVLGQHFYTNSAAGVLGDYVVAAGIGGQLAAFGIVDEQYVPGASTVFVRGSVDRVDAGVADIWIGQLQVSYQEALVSNPALVVHAGDFVESFGIQPSYGGTVLGQVLGINGGDHQSASAVLGINGGDNQIRSRVLGINGGDNSMLGRVLGIHGGDNQHASRVLGINGSDNPLQSGVLGINDSDVARSTF
jgi:hypothetical protein